MPSSASLFPHTGLARYQRLVREMANSFEYHPFYALSFVFFVLSSTFFALHVFFFPALLLLLLSTAIHDRYLALWMGSWFRAVVGFLEIIYGMNVRITGDQFPKDENCIIIMNHRTQSDWIVFWSFLARRGNPRWNKISLKNALRFIPGAGWGIQQGLFLFLRRNWEDDKRHFHRLLSYYVTGKRPFQFLIFPEGTDYCSNSKKRSNAFAKKSDLPIYNYVLHPRTKGFVEAMAILRKSAKSVIDVTIGYPVNIPEDIKSLAFGNFPHEVHFHAKYYPIEDLPEDSVRLEEWCRTVWEEKEERLKDFYVKRQFNGDFIVEESTSVKQDLLRCFIAWLLFLAGSLIALVVYPWFRWYVLISFVVYGILNAFGGAEKIVLAADDRLRRRASFQRHW